MDNKKLRETDVYDKEAVYKATIEPKVRDLMVSCLAERLPMFVSVAVKNSEGGTRYANTVVHGVNPVHLKDNRIARILLYLNGFQNEKYPADVEAAIQMLHQYFSSVKDAADISGVEKADVALTDDMISAFCRIAEGGE